MQIMQLTEIPNKIINTVNLFRKHVKKGKNLKINGKISIHGYGKITIGNDVVIHCNPHVNPIGGAITTFLQTIGDGKIEIGSNCGISHTAITAAKEVIIEDDVLLGSGCKIYDTDFHPLLYEARKEKIREEICIKPVKICRGAFIGAHSIILKGVTVGEKSVIGAGSVVTRDVPANQIWGGNPAKYIKTIDQR